ncbi:MAG: DMT family transporter [Veillonellaceae bacterium]|nr:DMT family transporter [Veillonellaceae bacterium]
MSKLTANLLVLLGSASYGMLSTVTKLAYQQGFSTAQVVGSQMFFGCLGFWLSSRVYWRQTFSLSLKNIGSLMLTGAMSGLTGVFYYLSLKTLPASYAVILLFQFTWMGIALDYIIHKRKPTLVQQVAAAIIMAGTLPAVGYSSNTVTTALTAQGVFLGLLSALSYTLFIYLSGSAVKHAPTIVRNNWMVAGAATTAFIVFPPLFLVDGSLAAGLWKYGGFLGLFGILLPFYLFAKGVPHIGTSRAAFLGAVELPVVIIFSVLLLNEPMTAIQLTGIGVILAGIFLSVSNK